jgi:hypothetical protein
MATPSATMQPSQVLLLASASVGCSNTPAAASSSSVGAPTT